MIIPALPLHNKYPFELVKLTPDQEKHVNEMLFEIDFARASGNFPSITLLAMNHKAELAYKHDALLCEYILHLLNHIPFPEEE